MESTLAMQVIFILEHGFKMRYPMAAISSRMGRALREPLKMESKVGADTAI